MNDTHQHIFIEGTNIKNVLILLHGTGGNEHDLINVGKHINPDASILGVRGNVLEGGMPRYFRRLSEGVFDEVDLFFRAQELHTFLKEALQYYAPKSEQITMIGYSNGANIAATLLMKHEKIVDSAILFHAMVPYRNHVVQSLDNTHVFIGAGSNDPIIPQNETLELIDVLRSNRASVKDVWYNNGHQLTMIEVEDAQKWYSSI
jgi:phospholipase/carboxylesterase